MPELQTAADGFLLDGEPFRILSGALHYFRVHPDHWQDRLRKARGMGLNTVDTYIPWNLHEPVRGSLRMAGGIDLPRFLDLAAAEGLHVLLRPGPYICGEWEGGGLPSWLLAEPGCGCAAPTRAIWTPWTTTSAGYCRSSTRICPPGAGR